MRTHFALLSIAALTSTSFGGIAYSFDSDDMGWGTVSDATGFMWDGTIGNGGLGAIRARDVVGGDIWYFSAPAGDLGNLSGLYGNSISYDLLGLTGNQALGGDRADVMISGAGMTIGIDFGVQPVLDQWISASTIVSADLDWRIVDDFPDGGLSGTDATIADIQAVLADVTGLYIRGEYTNGGDAMALDNVNYVPSPGALSMLSVAGLLIARRRR